MFIVKHNHIGKYIKMSLFFDFYSINVDKKCPALSKNVDKPLNFKLSRSYSHCSTVSCC